MQFVRKQRRAPTLNIIPLIDVLVVLLIFYIATTVFKKSEPKINIVIPSSTQATSTKDAVPSTIYVTEDSKLYLDDVLIDPAQLADTLKSKLAANPDWKVAMRADTKAPFGMITKVMDAAHDAGIAELPTYAQAPSTSGSGSGATTP